MCSSERQRDQEIFLRKDPDGRPVFVTAQELAGRLWGRPDWLTVEQLCAEYGISSRYWDHIAPKVGRALRRITSTPEAELAAAVNRRLAPHALAVPHLVSRAELDKLGQLTQPKAFDLPVIEELFFSLVMRPETRAQLLCARYMKTDVAREFAYIIDSSYFAYARGNVVAAYLTILPCIEGILLRWQGYDDSGTRAPAIADAHSWVLALPKRNPLATIPVFTDSWVEACATIMKEHLYKDTRTGESFGDFNRHLALHSLEGRRYCTPSNLLRAFLLLDLLVELYLRERNVVDPLLHSREEDRKAHGAAYVAAAIEPLIPGRKVPESILWKHAEYDFRRASDARGGGRRAPKHE